MNNEINNKSPNKVDLNTKNKWSKLETGKYFQKYINLLLDNKEEIINTPEYYYVNMLHLTILAEARVSVYLGTLLEIWEKEQFIIICPECNEKALHGYFFRHIEYFKKDDICPSSFYGVCNICQNLIVYELLAEDKLLFNDIRIPPHYHFVQNKLDKGRHYPSELTPFGLIEELSSSEQQEQKILSIPEPVIIRESYFSDEEIIKRKISTCRRRALRSMGWMGHLAFSHKTKKEQESYIHEKAEKLIKMLFDTTTEGLQ